MVRIAREAGLRDLEFIQDEMFRTVIYRPDVVTGEAVEGAIEGAIEGATKRVKDKLKTLLGAIASEEGKRVPDYEIITNITTKTLERYIQQLRDANLIEFKGDAAQTGGYYLTEQMKRKLK